MIAEALVASWDVLNWAQVIAAVFAVGAAVAIPLTAYRRRPDLSLTEEGARRHSRVEANGIGYLRLVVANKRRRRAAHGTRVIVEGYFRQSETDADLVSLSHPSLGWPSAVDAAVAAVTVHAGSGRPIGLGQFVRARRVGDGRLARDHLGNVGEYAADNPEARWVLWLALDGLTILDDRDKLDAGAWVVRLLVGADDGDARRYDVHVAWDGNPVQTAGQVLAAALDHLAVTTVD